MTGGGTTSLEASTARLVELLGAGAGGATFLWSGAHAGAIAATGRGQAAVVGAGPIDLGSATSAADLGTGGVRIATSFAMDAGFGEFAGDWARNREVDD
jgi:hypothetical protein